MGDTFTIEITTETRDALLPLVQTTITKIVNGLNFIKHINTIDESLMCQIVPVPAGKMLGADQINEFAEQGVIVGKASNGRQILVLFKAFLDFLQPPDSTCWKKLDIWKKRKNEAGACKPTRAYYRWLAFLDSSIKVNVHQVELRTEDIELVGCLEYFGVQVPAVENSDGPTQPSNRNSSNVSTRSEDDEKVETKPISEKFLAYYNEQFCGRKTKHNYYEALKQRKEERKKKMFGCCLNLTRSKSTWTDWRLGRKGKIKYRPFTQEQWFNYFDDYTKHIVAPGPAVAKRRRLNRQAEKQH